MSNYSTMGFLEMLRPTKRTMFTTEFIDPISDISYGYRFKFGPFEVLKIAGWMGETLKVVKFGKREWVWQ